MSGIHDALAEHLDGATVDELRGIREACDRRILDTATNTEGGNYRLLQHLRRARQALRDAEDYARLHRPGPDSPAADRIAEITRQITEDVAEGRTSIPSMVERAEKGDKAIATLHRIIGQDFRGPRPSEQTIAYEALKEMGEVG